MDCAGVAQTHLLASRLDEPPTFEDVYLTAQASLQMHVVFETIAPVTQNPCVFPSLLAALARDFRGLLCWSTMYTVENETPKSEISASVGLRGRSVS